MWRRRESDFVHSQSRVQACSREISYVMAVTLAERSEQGHADGAPNGALCEAQGQTSAATLQATRAPVTAPPPIPMEKFVIEGGVPLSGTIVPAGNKNGALPIMAACLLTEDEMVLRNVPRISDVEAMLLLLETLGAGVEWLSASEVCVRAGGVDRFE